MYGIPHSRSQHWINGMWLRITRSRTVDCQGYDNSNTADIVFPATITINATVFPISAILDEAFAESDTVKSVTFEGGPHMALELLGNGVFAGSSLKTIVIPNTIRRLGKRVFWNCLSLECVDFEEGTMLEKIPTECFRNTSLKEFRIPDSIVCIRSKAFKNSIQLAKVEFGVQSKLDVIENEAFASTGLVTFDLPKSVSLIQNNAFELCCNLIEFNIPEDSALREIRQSCFKGSALQRICLPKLCSSITGAFKDAINLTDVIVSPKSEKLRVADDIIFQRSDLVYSYNMSEHIVLENGLVEILHSAFAGRPLKSIHIPDTVKKLRDFCFCDCTALEEVVFDGRSDLQYIGSNCFTRSGIRAICIPSEVTTIKEFAFDNCPMLSSVTFEEHSRLKDIMDYAFDASKVRQIELPSGVDKLRNGVFVLSSLEEIILNSSLVMPQAFWMCHKIERIVFTNRREVRIEDDFCPLEKCYALEGTRIRKMDDKGRFVDVEVNTCTQEEMNNMIDAIRAKIE